VTGTLPGSDAREARRLALRTALQAPLLALIEVEAEEYLAEFAGEVQTPNELRAWCAASLECFSEDIEEFWKDQLARAIKRMAVPVTLVDAIAALVQSDVDRWGESEREHSVRIHSTRTYGLALNELANRAELAERPNAELRKAAKRALTSADRAFLRSGG